MNHTVRIVVKDLLYKDVQGLVELESSMTRGESRHKDIGLGAFDGIVLDIGVDSLQDVVGTETERTEIESRIGDEIEQMGGVLDSDGGGFVHPLAKLAPETVQHQFGGSLATGIFDNVGNRDFKIQRRGRDESRPEVKIPKMTTTAHDGDVNKPRPCSRRTR